MIWCVFSECQNFEATKEYSKQLDKAMVSSVEAMELKEVCAVTGQERKCFSCGFAPFNKAHKEMCPAKEIVCFGCNEEGHFQKTCKKSRKPTVAGRKVRTIQQRTGRIQVIEIKS